MKHIIIFGGAGFIGTNLTKRLLSQGNKVLCIDNLQTSYESNTELFKLNPDYKFVKADITEDFENGCIPNEVERYFEEYPNKAVVDEIYNLACPASPPKYQINPIHTLNTCIAIRDICELAKEYNAKLLHSSTSEVYGDPAEHPQSETYRGNVNCIGPRSCYDEGKRVAETYLYEYHKLGVDIKIVRIFNTYGPWMDPDDGRVVSNFICEALQNKDITIYGDGSQTRSFQYIDDLLNGIIKLMESDKFGPYNIGNPHEFTMIELAEKVLKKIPESTSKIVYCDLPKDDPTRRKANIAKAKADLDWEPKILLDEGLDYTIEYFSQKIEH